MWFQARTESKCVLFQLSGLGKDALAQKQSSLLTVVLEFSAESGRKYVSPASSLVLYAFSHHTSRGIATEFLFCYLVCQRKWIPFSTLPICV